MIFKQIYFTHRWDTNKYYYSGSRVELRVMAMKISRTGASPSDAD